MSDKCLVAAAYKTHTEVKQVIGDLLRSRFNIKSVSIIGRDHSDGYSTPGCYSAGGRMKYCGKLGTFWNGVWNLLPEAAAFMIPEVGIVLIGGPLVSSIIGELEDGSNHRAPSPLRVGLSSMGMPKQSILKYEAALQADRYVVIAHGAAQEVAKAKSIIQGTWPLEFSLHSGQLMEQAGAA